MTSNSAQHKPAWITSLEQAYGGPSQNAFGSAVFFDPRDGQSQELDLESLALAKYQQFCGKTWEQFGEENWKRTWKQVYLRDSGSSDNIVAELKSLEDGDARRSAALLIDGGASPDALQALSQAFNAPDISQLHIYKIGDGNAMSGVLVAATRAEGAIFLVMLMD